MQKPEKEKTNDSVNLGLSKLHKPVLLSEVIEALQVKKLAHLNKDPRFIDATLGLGGYSSEIISYGGLVLGVDADQSTINLANGVLEKISLACPLPGVFAGQSSGTPNLRYKLVKGNFVNIGNIARNEGFTDVAGIVFDLGISSFQIESDRGFSFKNPDSPLDMRIDPEFQGVKAADLLNLLDKSQLLDLFTGVLGKFEAIGLVNRIIERRHTNPFSKVSDLTELMGRKAHGKLNPATLAFLALRIAVNSEIENIGKVLPQAFELLGSGGRLVVVSFHSGEDRVVKRFFKNSYRSGLATVVTAKPLVPTGEEIFINPRARSAKLRVLEKR